ncbi:MAG: hypothetical protein U0797_20325 [Gemmataceae bacterium]
MARFLALDWDQNQLHVIAADVTKGSVRVRQARVWAESRLPNPALNEDLGKFLKEKLKEANIAPAPVLAVVGRDRLIVKDIRFPAVPDAEEPAVVRFQTVKELTDAAEDVVIDYVVTGQASPTERKAAALIVRRDLVEAYRGLCEAAGLKLAALSPRVMGVAACLRKVMGTTVITPLPTPRDGVIAVVNVGEKFAEFCILKGETFLLTRSVTNGPTLAGEVRRNLAVHAGQQPHLPVVGVYLTGVGSGELRQRLSDMIEQPVYTFDPFAWAESIDFGDAPAKKAGAAAMNVLQETDLPRPGAGPSVATRGTFAGAMGLLFLKAASAELPANFVSPRQPKPQANPNYRLVRLAVLAGVALFVGLFGLGMVLRDSATQELAAVQGDLQTVEKQLNDTRANAKRLKEIDEWDNVVLLDELYDLTARISDVNALRITSVSTEPYRAAKEKAVAKATIKGKLLDKRNPREAFNGLIDQFNTDRRHYRVESPTVKNDEFSFVVYIERRSPEEYKHVIKADKLAPPAAKKGQEADGDEADGDEGAGKNGKDEKGGKGAKGKTGWGKMFPGKKS